MEKDGHLTDKEYEAYETRVKALVDEAVDFAEKSEEPALHTLHEDVLAD
jgi:pyruvate dehydrogenase E1 component alpha subunit